MRKYISVIWLFMLTLSASAAFAWHDATHMAVMKAAGLGDYAYLAVGADMAKEKSGGREDGNHYRNNKKGTVVTAEMVLAQVGDYNCRCYDDGHLYGAIIAAVKEYRLKKESGKYALYPLGFAAHYIGDLSMPLHNVEYNEFNKANHATNDGVVEGEGRETTEARVARIAREIEKRMKGRAPYHFTSAGKDPEKFTREVAEKIAEIANKSISQGYAMQESDPQSPIMTPDEAYDRLCDSAMLLKAVYAAVQ